MLLFEVKIIMKRAKMKEKREKAEKSESRSFMPAKLLHTFVHTYRSFERCCRRLRLFSEGVHGLGMSGGEEGERRRRGGGGMMMRRFYGCAVGTLKSTYLPALQGRLVPIRAQFHRMCMSKI